MKIYICLIFLVITAPFISAAAQITWKQAYQKAYTALSTLSLEEKVALGTGTGNGLCIGNTAPVTKINWPGLCLQDSPLAVRVAYNVTGGIAGINAAATFDRNLALRRAHEIGSEFRGKGVNVQLGPDINLARVPEAGRNWEGFGEDPYLTGIMGQLSIQGVQDYGVIATAKHYILNEQETDRLTGTSNADDRTIHEVYAWPFARAVEADVGSVMCSYNQVNGIYGCENEDILNRILRQELNFQGFVQSDWGSTHSGAKSLIAGLDMDMPGPDTFWGANLLVSLQNGSVTQRNIDTMATRILATWYKLGQDQNYPPVGVNSQDPQRAPFIDVQDSHKKTIREIGAASAILLKNSENILPLNNVASLGIIGSDAGGAFYGPGGCTEGPCDTGTIAAGWGSGGSYFFDLVTPIQGITARANKTTRIKSSLSNNLNSAIQVAGAVDIAVVFVNADSGEGSDRFNLSLWNGGDDLINAVAQVNQNIVIVIHTPGAVLMPWVDKVKGIINAGLPGEKTGMSIADVLFGDVNPSGRLPYTIARKSSDYAAHASITQPVIYSEGLLIGYRWFDAKNITPHFEFGFGLSYTSFNYSNLLIQNQGKTIVVNASITNTGSTSGAEIPQLYIGFPQSAQEPPKILRGFERILLNPSQVSSVSFLINISKELSIWDTPSSTWKVLSGQYDVYVGASSRDIRLYGTLQL
ncbi:unnamed protein product [Umbelopsis ramanniana]